MRVKIFRVDQTTGAEILYRTSYASEIVEDNEMSDAEAAEMENALKSAGRYWLGGGAAPLFLLMRVPT